MIDLEELKKEAKKVLKEEKVKYIIGYKNSSNSLQSAPFFIKKPADVESLTWNPACIHNLTRFLVDEKGRKAREKKPDTRPVGIIVKGCDSRSIVVLLQEKFIDRSDIYIIGVSCEGIGVVDEKKLSRKLNGKKAQKIEFGKKDTLLVTTEDNSTEIVADDVLSERCRECIASFPVVYDVLFGDKVKKNIEHPFKSLEEIEALSQEEKWSFWREQLSKCIRCYACRSVCPMCYCDECVVDTINFAVSADTSAEEKAQKIKWVEKSPTPSENIIYHLVRAIHLAGRCIDCGECERACPLDIQIRLLNKKLEKETKELFGYETGFDPVQPPLISCFKDEDPEDFIR